MATLFHQAHTHWRESFKELRAAERSLVESMMRGGSTGTDLTALYEEVEQRRKRTSELFLRMERQGMIQAGPRAAVAAPNLDAAQQGITQRAASPQSAAPKQVAQAEPQP